MTIQNAKVGETVGEYTVSAPVEYYDQNLVPRGCNGATFYGVSLTLTPGSYPIKKTYGNQSYSVLVPGVDRSGNQYKALIHFYGWSAPAAARLES